MPNKKNIPDKVQGTQIILNIKNWKHIWDKENTMKIIGKARRKNL